MEQIDARNKMVFHSNCASVFLIDLETVDPYEIFIRRIQIIKMLWN